MRSDRSLSQRVCAGREGLTRLRSERSFGSSSAASSLRSLPPRPYLTLARSPFGR